MQAPLIRLVAGRAFALEACTGDVPGDEATAIVPIVAQAPDAGIVAIAGQASRTVPVMLAGHGGMVWIKDIRLPAGHGVTGLSVSAEGRDVLVGTESSRYLASAGAWTLQAVDALTRGPLIEASRAANVSGSVEMGPAGTSLSRRSHCRHNGRRSEPCNTY